MPLRPVSATNVNIPCFDGKTDGVLARKVPFKNKLRTGAPVAGRPGSTVHCSNLTSFLPGVNQFESTADYSADVI